ncbi:N(4)-(beta-N-acetylglucosaminyl)-L-asparaginase [Purpureocillium takamizusanense]|uniref:N(4)-(Beta-N-acetylglucosaminyl)-L-asparaginase n=1 Tax=Purpureocillium takamizusanense TaxID=2060973 RepID=A0A9Q8VAQ5_9HYPO|nr:N(4)-(beta-N-acetylglucosaminyl)-L-asparaginase [Purpureocillium takamizusanense]UNI18032.1 N(4)-(beta-N-acetylglucosaminyl)-L-asparaginase [Purpureocillium takamizusanense]
MGVKSLLFLSCCSLLLLARSSNAAVSHDSPGLPMVINTWGGPFTAATSAAFLTLQQRGGVNGVASGANASAVDAVEVGCATCERNQCDGTVGYGGSPDEACETTLDALIMDGTTFAVGAVAALRRVRHAIAVARMVMEHTRHTFLVGDQATAFAVQNGFAEGPLSTPESEEACRKWREGKCQPNYRVKVRPDPSSSCGPYAPLLSSQHLLESRAADGDETPSSPSPSWRSHDTLSLIALHPSGQLAAGTTTNGAAHKVPGRVGDGPIPGSGSYADSEVGGCGATGDGDVMMRFLPCYQAVESMRRGMAPGDAAEDAVRRMLRRFPRVRAGIVVVDRHGRHAGAAAGWTFTYAYRGGEMPEVKVVTVEPLNDDLAEL